MARVQVGLAVIQKRTAGDPLPTPLCAVNLQVLVLDGRSHLLGHLAAIMAKQVLLCCENINIPGNVHRNQWTYLTCLYQWMNTNPFWHPYQFQPSAPVKILVNHVRRIAP